ncbi:DUF1345 domain-containing protein [Acinetobacter sp. CAAS 2-6]|uniref:DUF1345 domain-containing protein n=1 Tax=Acinetobacter sp. CAAS 2-6 TaxID=3016358 RepID=UPI002DD64580|nr:DUF1345 domain-containing protein [Acinetobacter sp. CAAS 2-6]
MKKFVKRLHHGFSQRPYLSGTFALGISLYFILRVMTSWQWSTCLLLGWNVATWMYLLVTLRMMLNTSRQNILQRARDQDESKWVILGAVLVAVLVCLVGILVQLSQTSKQQVWLEFVDIGLTIATIFSTWLLIHTMFAIHYAHDYYLAKSRHEEPGLEFPKTEDPVYFDFIYFSYIVGTSAQTADIAVTSQLMRRLNIFHCVLAFAFNTVILAITINVTAGFLGV